MSVKIGINGFGRIGRNVVRALLESKRKEIEVVAINELTPVETSAFLLEHDSNHGHIGFEISHGKSEIKTKFGSIQYSSIRSPADINWLGKGVDLVFECTGMYATADKAKMHLGSGAKKVIVSAPSDGSDITVVYGVNHQKILSKHKVISAASCTTNCLAPIISVLEEFCGVEQGFMTTIHAYTQDQKILDSGHSDLFRSRSAAQNIIPTSTGAAKAVSHVLPAMKGKIDGIAVRVPTPNVSAVDFVFLPTKEISIDDINNEFLRASEVSPFKGVLAVTNKPLVSSDFNHNPASSIFHSSQTNILSGGLAKVFSWYDNEWGFSNRMLDIAEHLYTSKLIQH